MATRQYRKGDLVVHWDSELCYHSAHCIRTAPKVFMPNHRPWVVLERGEREQIIAAVEACPSGALSYTIDGEDKVAAAATTIFPEPNGPLVLTGNLQVVDSEGAVVREAGRLSLCRCGNSENKPFCDNSHRRVGFEDPGLEGRGPGR